jgi:hypothetical protein
MNHLTEKEADVNILKRIINKNKNAEKNSIDYKLAKMVVN